jgi:hypothetical protein
MRISSFRGSLLTDKISTPNEALPAVKAIQPELWQPYTLPLPDLNQMQELARKPNIAQPGYEAPPLTITKQNTDSTPLTPKQDPDTRRLTPYGRPYSIPRSEPHSLIRRDSVSLNAPPVDTSNITPKPLLPRLDLYHRPSTANLAPIAREEVLKGSVPDGAWQTLQHFDLSKDHVNAVRKEINQFRADPLTVWTNAIRDGRVLGVGEMHNQGSPHRKFAIAHFGDLGKAGATHFAIELPSDEQKSVMNAIKTGRAGNQTLDEFFKSNPEILEMMRAAQKAGMQVIAVDLNESTSSHNIVNNKSYDMTRDEYMAHKIDTILKADPHNKVVYWCGGLHLTNPVNAGDKQRLSAGEILKRDYKVTTIYDQTKFHSQTVAYLANDITTPVAVPTARSPKLAALQINPPGSSWNVRYGNWDYIFIYPNK